jgi:glycerol-3-phosphate acyltransferase PlsY
MEPLLASLLRLVGAYLLGSLNGALLLGRLRGVDIRTQGSGNAGGTNALRTQGPAFALGVVVIDVLKAWIAVRVLGGPGTTWLAVGCGLAAVLGHVYPVFHGFRGGKGVATLLGTLLAVSPLLLGGVLAVWLVMMMLFGMVGLGSIVASAALPLLALIAARQGAVEASAVPPLVGFGVACALLVLWTHRANLARMRAGTEPRAKRLWLLGRLRGRT